MPAIRLIVFKYHTLFTSSIALNGEIINPCSCYAKKELVCVIIIKPFNYQPSSCFKCTKSNTCALYNVHSVPLNKCTFLTHLNSL